ncbi:two-component system sensor histidine kinase NtrB [Halorubrum laminariae]|uniref:histidine kinase n=1 Tax=Halorubrum laminariae TaxID=1433523 RepID=A0ABD6C2R2_9EURY|nr:PAS domain S-box protein [Halorubrum laminariae]
MDADHSPVTADDFYQTLVENAAEGMLTIDENSDIVYANPAIEDILGYTPQELIGSSKMEIIPERLEPVHAAALESYVETGARNIDWNGIELPALHKDGHEVPTLISLREHEHHGDRYFTGIIRDVTERRRRENQLRDQKERLDEFADILTHDIRNPLSVAEGYTKIAREQDDSPELAKIEEALTRIDTLVDDVLDLSKEGRSIGETDVIDIGGGVREAWESVETHEATIRVDDGLGTVEADESRLQELLENLFRNAIDHAGSAPTVRIGPLSDDAGLYVEDDGAGIPASIRSDVFDHGYSTDQDGTGYGLSIVAKIVDGHGWDISVTEGTEGGARFEITW